MRSILQISPFLHHKLRSSAGHPENLKKNAGHSENFVRCSLKITLPRGASSKFGRVLIHTLYDSHTYRHACIHTYIQTDRQTYPKQTVSGLLYGGPCISLLEIYRGNTPKFCNCGRHWTKFGVCWPKVGHWLWGFMSNHLPLPTQHISTYLIYHDIISGGFLLFGGEGSLMALHPK